MDNKNSNRDNIPDSEIKVIDPFCPEHFSILINIFECPVFQQAVKNITKDNNKPNQP